MRLANQDLNLSLMEGITYKVYVYLFNIWIVKKGEI